MTIQEHISLKPYNTFGIQSVARYFIEAGNENDLRQLFLSDEWSKIPKYFLGGGSNVLLTRDINGLVIVNRILGKTVVGEDDNHVWVEFGSGENWHNIVMYSIEQGWSGIENLSLIPGTIGAAPMQNIGAYGVELKDVFESLQAMEVSTGEIHTFDASSCQFGYRESVFKKELKGKYFITSVKLRLNKHPHFKVEYGDIKKTLDDMHISELSIKAISDAVIKIRSSKLPNPEEIGNAGSFFKNPEVPISVFNKLKKHYLDIPHYPINDEIVKVPAGWLIEKTGWKGYRKENIGVHKNQALVLVNYGEGETGTGADLLELANEIKNSVYKKFGIEIIPEVNVI